MNRIPFDAHSDPKHGSQANSAWPFQINAPFQPGTAEKCDEEWSLESPHVYLPNRHEMNYAYPLIVRLVHSHQVKEYFCEWMEEISDQNYIGLELFYEPSDSVEKLFAKISQAVEQVAGHSPINNKQVYLLGEGASGNQAIELALAHPHQFAGFIARQPAPLNGSQSLYHFRLLRHLRGYIEDSASPETSSVKDYARLLHNGGLDIHYQPAEKSVTPWNRLVDHFIMQGIWKTYLKQR